MLGVGLYGLTYIYPDLSRPACVGFSALQIGETMFVSPACAMFAAAPLVGRLMTARPTHGSMIGLGFLGFAVGTWQASFVTKDWDFWELLVPQMLRASR